MTDGGLDSPQRLAKRKAPRAARIAYIGSASGTSLHRAHALERLGHKVTIIDPQQSLPQSKWVSRWIHYAGGRGMGLFINLPILKAAQHADPHLIWVDQGNFFSAGLIRRLRLLGVPIVNYTIDDPFGGRDGRRFDLYLSAIPFYDLIVVVRPENVEEAHARGAKKVLLVRMTADEIAHRPRDLTQSDIEKWQSDVCFIGTWMPERGPFMAKLIKAGIPLAIWGDRWEKDPEWQTIKPSWRGPGIYDDDSYAAAIQSAKICLGLLSKGNRDQHTTRSMEIPALGSLLCAERTVDHLKLYIEGEEAVFWDSAEECASICKQLLCEHDLRSSIAMNGHRRLKLNKTLNEHSIQSVLEYLMIFD